MSITTSLKAVLMHCYDANKQKYTMTDAKQDMRKDNPVLAEIIEKLDPRYTNHDGCEVERVVIEFDNLYRRYRENISVWYVIQNEHLVSSKPLNGTDLPCAVTSKELRVGDIIRRGDSVSPFNTMVVCAETKNTYTIFRPYVHVGDCGMAHSSHGEDGTQIICSVGTEQHTFDRRSTETFMLLQREFVR